MSDEHAELKRTESGKWGIVPAKRRMPHFSDNYLATYAVAMFSTHPDLPALDRHFDEYYGDK